MKVTIETALAYQFDMPTDVLLQVEAARMSGQEIVSDALFTTPVEGFRRVTGEAALGKRVWLQASGRFEMTYQAEVEVTRPDVDLSQLSAANPRSLTSEATSFLLPSRYCQSDEFGAYVLAEYADLQGGQLIVALRDWIEDAFSYVPGSSGPTTTALETLVHRQGVCRDYAHVMISLARAAGIPARMASVYAPRAEPPDFHAVAEVWLEDAWYLVDATGMALPSEMVVIGVGRDVAEVSFLTSFGSAGLISQSVSVLPG